MAVGSQTLIRMALIPLNRGRESFARNENGVPLARNPVGGEPLNQALVIRYGLVEVS